MAGLMKSMMVVVCFLSGLISCQTQEGTPIDPTPPRNVQTLGEVMAPVHKPKSGFVTIICDTLTVDVSPEIYIGEILKKFTNTYHMQRREDHKRPVTETFKNTSGGVQNALEFRIHSTNFIVIKSAVFRIHYKGEARFDLLAGGNVQIVEKGAKGPRNVSTLSISEGVWKEK